MALACSAPPALVLQACFEAQTLRTQLRTFGAAAQVFRTYNASVTLDRLLTEQEQELAEGLEAAGGSRQRPESPTVDKRKADYDRANKEARDKLPGSLAWSFAIKGWVSLQNSSCWTSMA